MLITSVIDDKSIANIVRTIVMYRYEMENGVMSFTVHIRYALSAIIVSPCINRFLLVVFCIRDTSLNLIYAC